MHASSTPQPVSFATAADLSRLLQTTQEWVLEHLAHLALKLPGGELRWDQAHVLRALRAKGS